jgi:enediyne polyketide synthase
MAAVECLRAAGLTDETPFTDETPLAVDPVQRDAWVVFTAGTRRVATFVTAVRDLPGPVVFAILTEGRS